MMHGVSETSGSDRGRRPTFALPVAVTHRVRESAAPRRALDRYFVVDDPQTRRGVPWYCTDGFSTLKIKNRAQCEFVWWSSGGLNRGGREAEVRFLLTRDLYQSGRFGVRRETFVFPPIFCRLRVLAHSPSRE